MEEKLEELFKLVQKEFMRYGEIVQALNKAINRKLNLIEASYEEVSIRKNVICKGASGTALVWEGDEEGCFLKNDSGWLKYDNLNWYLKKKRGIVRPDSRILDVLSVYIGFKGWSGFTNESRFSQKRTDLELPDDIIGRRKIVLEIQDLILSKKSKNATIVLHGIGGVGKTHLLVTLKSLKFFTDEFEVVEWITVSFDPISALIEHFNKTEVEFKYSPSQNLNSNYARLLRMLKSFYPKDRRVIIFDNVDDVEHLELLRNFSDKTNWKVIISTRHSPLTFGHWIFIPLLSVEDAKSLFHYHYQKKDWNEQDVSTLVSVLGYHPLLISVYANVGNHHPELGIKALLEISKTVRGYGNRSELDTLIRVDPMLGRTTEEYISAKDYLVQIFSFSNISSSESLILTLLSAMPIDQYDLKYLHNLWYLNRPFGKTIHQIFIKNQDSFLFVSFTEGLIPLIFPRTRKKKVWTKLNSIEKFEGQFRILKENGWLNIWEGKVQMHPIVQKAIHEVKSPSVHNCRYLLGGLIVNLEVDEEETATAKEREIRIAEYSIKVINDINPQISNLLNSIGTYYFEGEETKEKAHQYFEASQDRKKTVLSFLIRNSVFGAMGKINLGHSCREFERYDEAISHFDSAIEKLELLQQSWLPFSRKLKKAYAEAFNGLGLVYQDKGNQEKSMEYLRKSLEIRLKGFGPESILVGNSYYNMASVYHDLKNEEKAWEHNLKALQIYEKLKLGDHPHFGKICIRIGSEYGVRKEYEKGLYYTRKGKEIKKNLFGEESIEFKEAKMVEDKILEWQKKGR